MMVYHGGMKTARTRYFPLAAGAAGAVAASILLRRLLVPSVETRLHVPGEDGLVEASPAGLAQAAGVPLPTYALASAMQSEEHNDRGRLAVGRAIWNKVRGRSDKIFEILCPTGRFGRQTVNPYAATSMGPTARTLGLAQAIVEGRVPDFVEGAVQWDSPSVQDKFHRLYLRDPVRYPKYRMSSADIATRRVAGGAREVRVPGVPHTRFWSYT